MVNDRGNIKWTTMMLPEHVEALRQLAEQQKYKNKPILDDQLIEENEFKLQMAIHDHLTVEIKYFKDHNFHWIKGELRSIAGSGTLTINDNDRTEIKFSDVIEVNMDE